MNTVTVKKMFKKVKQIISCELKIARLQKQIRALNQHGNSELLFKKKQELLEQLRINHTHPFGFKDMKELAIAELTDELARAASPARKIFLKARKQAAMNKEAVTE